MMFALILTSGTISCVSSQAQNSLTPVLLGQQSRLRNPTAKPGTQLSMESVEEENTFFATLYLAGGLTDKAKLESILIETAEQKKASKPSFRIESIAVSSGGYMDLFYNGYYVKVKTAFSVEENK